MAEIPLVAETGRPTGSRPANRLRAQGKVPGVVYGHGASPMAVAVEWRDLRHALTTDAGLNALIDLTIDGDTQLTIVKDLQRDPVKRQVTHVDFIRISRDEAITVDVPISLEGEAEAVLREDGTVDQVLFALTITSKPGSIPNEITVDVSSLEIGDSIRVGDLRLPEGVTTDVDDDETIVAAHAAELEVVEEAEEEEGEEGAEAAAGEGAEGTAAAEPGKGAADSGE
jgi:large subunit ribosomal protein L25